jgi:hypothetical protein
MDSKVSLCRCLSLFFSLQEEGSWNETNKRIEKIESLLSEKENSLTR